MSKDDLKWGRSYVREEEEERLKQTAINIAREDGMEQKEQEIIMSMYEEGCDLAYISRIVKVDISKVEQIIKEMNNNKVKRKYNK